MVLGVLKLISTALVVIFLGVFLLAACYFLSFFLFKGDRKVGAPFECGFQPFRPALFTFSMPFFVLSLIFLLFDVEILFICFYPFSNLLNLSFGLVIFLVLLIILFSTLFEWGVGLLRWM